MKKSLEVVRTSFGTVLYGAALCLPFYPSDDISAYLLALLGFISLAEISFWLMFKASLIMTLLTDRGN